MGLAKARTDMAVEQKIQNLAEYDDGQECIAYSANRGSVAGFRGPRPMESLSSMSMAAPPPMSSSAIRAGFGSSKRALVNSVPACEVPQPRIMQQQWAPQQQQQFIAQPQQQQQQQHPTRNDAIVNVKGKTNSSRDIGTSIAKADGVDFTLLPQLLDAAVEESDEACALRSTIIKTKGTWRRNRQENLLSGLKLKGLGAEEIKKETNKAMDLLDALSRSGSLAIESSELHVIVAVTHCFEKDIIGTIIQDNINPIQKIESSTLLFASAIHGVDARDLVKDEAELNRLEGLNPLLLKGSERAEEDDELTRSASC